MRLNSSLGEDGVKEASDATSSRPRLGRAGRLKRFVDPVGRASELLRLSFVLSAQATFEQDHRFPMSKC